ncbi:MAG: PEP-CTERM sorting domain-containing protein [Phycisphaeraceae bacterium]|nr:PEP-CTERM sorting domain-containing protein [Phycisphaeraceae bacterium]
MMAWGSGWAMGAISGNLVGGGDFEETGYLVNETSPRGILPHRFDQVYDLNRWIAHWGPPSNPGGLGGFSTYNNPRDLNETGGDGTPSGSDLGNFNRSADPLNPGNHIMEATMFHPSMTQWIVGPTNQKPGPIHFSFDSLLDVGDMNFDSWCRVVVYGMNYLPPDDVSFFRDAEPGAPGATYSVYDPALNPDDGEVLFSFTYGKWIEGSTDGNDAPFEYLGVWQHYDTDEYLENQGGEPIELDGTPDYQWWGSRVVQKELAQTYPYYVVAVYPVVSEPDPWFGWLRITDSFAFGVDNLDWQVSVQVRGDFNDDGAVTLSDINLFKLALTDTAGYQGQYPDVPIDLVDPDGDGAITLSDIPAFRALLVSGAGAEVPEPGTMSLLVVGALTLVRRR